jgi:hypothetical protein
MPDSPSPIVSLFLKLYRVLSKDMSKVSPIEMQALYTQCLATPTLSAVKAQLSAGTVIENIQTLDTRVNKLAALVATDQIIGHALNSPESEVSKPLRYLKKSFLKNGHLFSDASTLILPRRQGYGGILDHEGFGTLVNSCIVVTGTLRRSVKTVNTLNGVEITPSKRHPKLQKAFAVACCSLIDGPDDLHFTKRELGALHYYDIRAKDAVSARIRKILVNLDASGASIGMLPELSLTEHLLKHWQAEIRRALSQQDEARRLRTARFCSTGQPEMSCFSRTNVFDISCRKKI